MAEENTAAPTGIGRRTILIIAAGGGLYIFGNRANTGIYFTGALSGNDEIIERLNAIEGVLPVDIKCCIRGKP